MMGVVRFSALNSIWLVSPEVFQNLKNRFEKNFLVIKG